MPKFEIHETRFNWNRQFRFSSFLVPLSIFDFPVSSFEFRFSSFDFKFQISDFKFLHVPWII